MTSGLAATVNFGLHFNICPALSASGPPTATIGQPYTHPARRDRPAPHHQRMDDKLEVTTPFRTSRATQPRRRTPILSARRPYSIVASATDDTRDLHRGSDCRHRWRAVASCLRDAGNVGGVDVRFNDVINAASIHLYDAMPRRRIPRFYFRRMLLDARWRKDGRSSGVASCSTQTSRD